MPESGEFGLMIEVLEIVGTIAFAVSGAMVGVKKKHDLFGVLFLGIITSLGGGTLRDVLIGNIPPITQYREMEVFTQFSSDLDAVTKEQLQYGKGLMELLKQPLCEPMSLHEQVITLCAASHKLLLDVPVKELKRFQRAMLTWIDEHYPRIGDEINRIQVLDEHLTDEIIRAVKEYKEQVVR